MRTFIQYDRLVNEVVDDNEDGIHTRIQRVLNKCGLRQGRYPYPWFLKYERSYQKGKKDDIQFVILLDNVPKIFRSDITDLFLIPKLLPSVKVKDVFETVIKSQFPKSNITYYQPEVNNRIDGGFIHVTGDLK